MNKKIFAFIFGASVAGYAVKRVWKRRFSEETTRGDTEEKLKQLYYHWLLLNQKSITLSDCLLEMGANKIAVLGLDPQGRRLIDDLSDSDVDVLYAIERDNPSAVHEKLEVLRLGDDPLPETDAVVICTPHDFEVIKNQLSRETTAKVITLESLIANALESRGLKTRDGVMNPLKLKTSERYL